MTRKRLAFDCNKIAYSDAGAVLEARGRLIAADKAKDEARLRVYRCRTSTAWHLGHVPALPEVRCVTCGHDAVAHATREAFGADTCAECACGTEREQVYAEAIRRLERTVTRLVADVKERARRERDSTVASDGGQ